MIFFKKLFCVLLVLFNYIFNYFKVSILNTRDLVLMTFLERLKFRNEIKELLLYSLFLNYYRHEAKNTQDGSQNNPCGNAAPQWSCDIYKHFFCSPNGELTGGGASL